jgi:hypothetical protein
MPAETEMLTGPPAPSLGPVYRSTLLVWTRPVLRHAAYVSPYNEKRCRFPTVNEPLPRENRVRPAKPGVHFLDQVNLTSARRKLVRGDNAARILKL